MWELGVRLLSTSSGKIVFDQKWEGYIPHASLAFNNTGDQLLLVGLNSAYAFTFGQAYEGTTMSSRQVCDAIAGAISWTNTLVEDEDEDDWY